MASTAYEPRAQRLLRRANKDELARLIQVAAAMSGQIVPKTGLAPGDDLCPTFRFPYPLPPRFNLFLEEATAVCGMIRLFPYGTSKPEGVLVQVNMSVKE